MYQTKYYIMARYFLCFLSLTLLAACQNNDATTQAEQKLPARTASLSETTIEAASLPPQATKVPDSPEPAEVQQTPAKKALPARPDKKTEAAEVKQSATTENAAEAIATEPPKTPKVKPQAEEPAIEKEQSAAPFSHDIWNTLLQEHVSPTGLVNYKGFQSDVSTLDAYLESLSANPPQSSWDSNEKLAYWINAYNAFTVKLILNNYPTSSITKLAGGKPWDVKWIKIGKNTYSLNHIENNIIRPRFKDARIHFAVNCAALSCPPLLNQAYVPSRLSAQLNSQTRKFINNPKYNTITAQAIEVSKIFDWYSSDFGSSLIDYLNKYSAHKINNDAKIQYLEYDWALNSQ
jgi:hypothetical protein